MIYIIKHIIHIRKIHIFCCLCMSQSLFHSFFSSAFSLPSFCSFSLYSTSFFFLAFSMSSFSILSNFSKQSDISSSIWFL